MEINKCESCPVYVPGNLVRMGLDKSKADFIVALAGNPNTGKSTVFNKLTGLKQHTGNWPGKTVTRAEGGFSYAGKRFRLIDLPGTYSLLSTSTDEEVARDFILFGKPNVTIIVVDATRLERNLNLVLQVLEITDKVVVCLNLVDEAERHQIKIDERALSRELGVPVVPAAARQGRGIPDLLKYVYDVAVGNYICKPHRINTGSKELKNAVGTLTEKLEEQFPDIPNSKWIALRLLEGDQRIIDAVKSGEIGSLAMNKAYSSVEEQFTKSEIII